MPVRTPDRLRLAGRRVRRAVGGALTAYRRSIRTRVVVAIVALEASLLMQG